MTIESSFLPGNSAFPLEDFDALADANFAQEWKVRYLLSRTQMIPDIARWMRLLRYFHPRNLQDHWQDQYGNPLPKLFQSTGLSVEIYNWCRPIIEVYGSLLAGQKPLPFTIDVRSVDPTSKAENFRADAQEKLLLEEIRNQRIPLHFLDFCVSVVLFGIGYVYSWIDHKDRRLRTQAISWPGDVIPQWGSDRYGRGGDGLESCILSERVPLDVAKRLYPDVELQPSTPEYQWRPDGTVQATLPSGTVQVLKIWWRWADEKDDEKIGYAEVAYSGTRDGEPATLYREDDTGYPDIPVRWAARFQTPGEPPHRAAGVLDDVIGLNAEFNERMSALADLLMKSVYTKYKAKGFTITNIPRLAQGSNMYPMGPQQDMTPLVEQIGNVPFETFLGRLENMMLTLSGLSKLIIGGALPDTETSSEAIDRAMHAAISRLEVIRTPIQYAWMSLIEEVWVPILVKFGQWSAKDQLTGRMKSVTAKELFADFDGIDWIWPDVTPRDAMKTVELYMNMARGGWMSDETLMRRAQMPSPLDEIEKIRTQRKDDVMHPESVRNTAMAQQTVFAMQRAQQPVPRFLPQVRVNLRGDLSPEEVQGVAGESGIPGGPPAISTAGTSMEPVTMSTQPDQSGASVTPTQRANPFAPPTDTDAERQAAGQAQPGNPFQGLPQKSLTPIEQMAGQVQSTNIQMQAQQTPKLSQEDNTIPPGSLDNAAQGVNSRVPPPKPVRK